MTYREATDGKDVQFDVFSDIAVKHFMQPRNQRPLKRVNGKGCTSNESLEDFMQISVFVNPEGIIEEIRCRTVGCAAAVACGSVFTEMVLGLAVEEALSIRAEDVLEALGGLPDNRKRYAQLPQLALQAAVENYEERQSRRKAKRLEGSFVYRRLSEVRV
mgnify:CR=1 FL=1